jgi:hypothetical protein
MANCSTSRGWIAELFAHSGREQWRAWGTPLLRKDRQTTREISGTYIHIYKFSEAVADTVILERKYEARDVPQRNHLAAVVTIYPLSCMLLYMFRDRKHLC